MTIIPGWITGRGWLRETRLIHDSWCGRYSWEIKSLFTCIIYVHWLQVHHKLHNNTTILVVRWGWKRAQSQSRPEQDTEFSTHAPNLFELVENEKIIMVAEKGPPPGGPPGRSALADRLENFRFWRSTLVPDTIRVWWLKMALEG